jgi:aminopeptidase N
VTSHYFPLHAAAGEAVLQTTVAALELYGELFGPYPRPILSVVEADFLDGMEYEGLYFLSKGFYNLYQGTPGELLVAIAAHETAHQWWYARVGNDQALEPWLDEALCTYSERIYYENVAPEALEWWWAYRVNYYEPSGPVDGSIYNPGGFRPYRDAVYLNGAVFLEALRGVVGETAFFATLRDYAARYSGKIATGKDFFDVLREHTDADFNQLVKDFFQDPPE